jgi:hypothetical protein
LVRAVRPSYPAFFRAAFGADLFTVVAAHWAVFLWRFIPSFPQK